MRSSGRSCRIHSSGGRRIGRRRPESGSLRKRVLFHTQTPAYFSRLGPSGRPYARPAGPRRHHDAQAPGGWADRHGLQSCGPAR
jgi:hypothetical protein